jgi:putative peptide zinc metalloprotease protein
MRSTDEGIVRIGDPLRSIYWQFTDEQWAAAQRLDGSMPLANWLRERVAGETDRKGATYGWTRLFVTLEREGLIVGGRSATGGVRWKDDEGTWWRTPWAIRLVSFPAEPWVGQLERLTRFGFAKPMRIVWGLLAVTAAILLVAGIPKLLEEGRDVPQWLHARHLIGLPLLVALVKGTHELGHAIAARRSGARVREFGMMLFFGSPCPYVDVSDVWLVPSRARRMFVTIAGSAVEGVIASSAILIWSMTSDGPIHAFAWFVIVATIGGNLLLNLNPLMRYDGYFLLSDAVGIPNLHAVAVRCRRSLWIRLLTGADAVPTEGPSRRSTQGARERRHAAFWGLFGLAAGLYRGALTMLIGLGIVRLAEPFGLAPLAWTGLLLMVLTAIVRPLIDEVRQVGNGLRRRPGRSQKALGRGGVALIVVVVALSFPLPGRVSTVGRIRSADGVPLIAVDGGHVVANVVNGAEVEAGERIASIVDPRLSAERLRQRTELDVARAELEASLRLVNGVGSEQTEALSSDVERRERELELLEQRIERGKLTAPFAGRIVSRPVAIDSRDVRADRIVMRIRDPFDPTFSSGTVKAGAELGTLVPIDGRWEAVAEISEAELTRIAIGDPVIVRAPSDGYRARRGTVASIGTRSELRHDAPPEAPTSARNEERERASRFDDRIALVVIRIDETPRGPEPIGLDEPVEIAIRTASESLLGRAWRWGSRQFYWPW